MAIGVNHWGSFFPKYICLQGGVLWELFDCVVMLVASSVQALCLIYEMNFNNS